MKTYVNDQTKKLIQKRYEELKDSGETKGLLSKDEVGGLELFINTQPKYKISELAIGDDVVYLGSEELLIPEKK